VMTKALHELSGSTDDQAAMATAFEELIEAISERDEGDEDGDGKLNEHEARELWGNLQGRLDNEYNRVEGGFARLMYGGTDHNTRRLLQLAFNRPNSNPRVLVAQSVVGREGLNLHRACKTVVLLHPEWNPGVVEQQIGRVDRVGSKWEADLAEALSRNTPGDSLPRILIRPVVFRGTYDEHNWEVLKQRWDDLRAQLHGVVISSQLEKSSGIPPEIVNAINNCAPRFHPESGQKTWANTSPQTISGQNERLCEFCNTRSATTKVKRWDTWINKTWYVSSCGECAKHNQQDWLT